MNAQILVVDDEPDLEALILQKFRHQIRDGSVSFFFARDGVEALSALKTKVAVTTTLPPTAFITLAGTIYRGGVRVPGKALSRVLGTALSRVPVAGFSCRGSGGGLTGEAPSIAGLVFAAGATGAGAGSWSASPEKVTVSRSPA